MSAADNDPPDRKRRYRRISREETEAILELYTINGLSSVEIGRKLERDPAIVRRVLHDHGIRTPKLKWDADKAVELIGQGMSVQEVSRIVGKNAKSIRQYLSRHTKSE
jgi:transposase